VSFALAVLLMYTKQFDRCVYIGYAVDVQVCQPAKEKKKLRKLRKDTLKDEEKKLFPEVLLLSGNEFFSVSAVEPG